MSVNQQQASMLKLSVIQEEETQDAAREVKIVLIGNASVGKTCIISRLVRQEFEERTSTTVGAMFYSQEIEVDGKIYQMHIWDTAGQERLRAIAPLYYRDANGILLVYDITSKDSFLELQKWVTDIQTKGNQDSNLLVVGNKFDLSLESEVTESEATAYAKTLNAEHIYVSAKDGTNIQECFAQMVRSIHERWGTGFMGSESPYTKMMRKTQKLKGTKPEESKTSTCCIF